MSYPSSIDTFAGTTAQGTSLLSSPDHALDHRTLGSAASALETKIGLSAGTPVLDKVLVGSGNGTSIWGSVVNNLTLGTPSITGGTITNSTLSGITGLTKAFTTVGTANADYITDGTADEVQIQAAIDAVNAAGGGVVYIKEGTYSITNNTAAPAFLAAYAAQYCGLIMKSGVTVRGAGIGKTTLSVSAYVTGTNDRFMMFVNAAAGDVDIEVSELSISLPSFVVGGSAYWGDGLWMAGASRAKLKNVRIVNGGFRFDGYTVTFNSTTKELATDGKDILIDNVIVQGFLGSCALFKVRNVTVSNCTLRQPYDDPLIIADAGQQLKFINNYIDGDGATDAASNGGIYFACTGVVAADPYTMSDILILGNTIRNLKAGNGIGLLGSGGNRDVRIIGNTLRGNPGVGILLLQMAKNTIIAGNNIILNQNGTVAGATYFGGISINTVNSGDAISNVQIANNIIANNTYYGIYVNSAGTATTLNNITVTGNEIYDDQGTATQGSGVVFIANNANLANVVSNLNNIHDTATPYTFTPGTGTIGGGNLFVDSGALKYRGGAATTTTLANA